MASEKRTCVTVDDIGSPALMVNNNNEVVWLNELARKGFSIGSMPDELSERSIQSLLGTKVLGNEWLTLFFNFCNEMQKSAKDYGTLDINWHHVVHGLKFREGILLIFDNHLKERVGIGHVVKHRGDIIKDVLRKKLPVLTEMATIVADIQNSTQICSRMMPFNYFELLGDLFRRIAVVCEREGGVYGRHAGDGVFYYFFKQPGREHRFAAINSAVKMRQVTREVECEWQEKGILMERIHLNIGINEGKAWVGVSSSPYNELMALGESINIGSSLSEMAKDGQILVTKSTILSMPESMRSRVAYGVSQGSTGFIRAGEYSQIRQELSHLPITEVRDAA